MSANCAYSKRSEPVFSHLGKNSNTINFDDILGDGPSVSVDNDFSSPRSLEFNSPLLRSSGRVSSSYSSSAICVILQALIYYVHLP